MKIKFIHIGFIVFEQMCYVLIDGQSKDKESSTQKKQHTMATKKKKRKSLCEHKIIAN